MARNWALLGAAVLLALTALFHLTGTSDARSWVAADNVPVMLVLWISCSAVWMIVAICWAFHFVTLRHPEWPLLLTTAAVPAVVGLPLLLIYGGTHPGAYMLLLSSALALWSGRKVKG